MLGVLGLIILLLLALLFTPLGVSVDYVRGGVRLAARVMAFDLVVYQRGRGSRKRAKPRSAKKPRAKKPKAKKPAKADKPKKARPPLVTKEMIPDLLRLLGDTLSRFRRKFTVNRFILHLTFGGADPYSAVMAYGTANAALATVGRRLGGSFNVKRSEVLTGIDFDAEKTSAELGLTVTITLARIIAVAVFAGIGFLKIKRKAAKAQKAAAKERMATDERDADPDGRVS